MVTGGIWVFDSNVLISLMEWHPLRLMPEIWRELTQRAHEGRVVVPYGVREELDANDLFNPWWEKLPTTAIHEPDTAELKLVSKIQDDFPALAPKGNRPRADAYVIAAAMALQGTVVSDEKTSTFATKGAPPFAKSQKMDAACKYLNVEYVDGKAFIAELLYHLRNNNLL